MGESLTVRRQRLRDIFKRNAIYSVEEAEKLLDTVLPVEPEDPAKLSEKVANLQDFHDSIAKLLQDGPTTAVKLLATARMTEILGTVNTMLRDLQQYRELREGLAKFTNKLRRGTNEP